MFARLRLRNKLALSLVLAALLPVLVAATVAVRIVLRGLEDGLRDQTSRQLRVGMNLVLRNVQRLGGDAERLASTPALVDAMRTSPEVVADVLAREDPHLPSAWVQIVDAKGQVVSTRAIGGDLSRYVSLDPRLFAPVIARGLQYERRVTITQDGEKLVVHAVAPIVDPSYELVGAVVMSLPLDGDFADGIKAALGTDVLIHSGSRPAMSSFLDEAGGRVGEIMPPEGIAADVLSGGTRQSRAEIGGRDYSLGYAPLKDLDGDHVGMFAVAVGRESLGRAKSAAFRSLLLGAAGAVAFALGLAGLLSRRLTRPIARLHEGALAIARGELDTKIPAADAAGTDEMGDLAAAFNKMTGSLRENQERLAARMREIVALHEAGRAVSSVLALDAVLRKIVDSVARVLDARLAAIWLVDTAASPDLPPLIRIGAARAKAGLTADLRTSMHGDDAEKLAEPLAGLAAQVAARRDPLRLDAIADAKAIDAALGEEPDRPAKGGSSGPPVVPGEDFAAAARKAKIDGSLLAIPLERGQRVVGVLVVGRGGGTVPAFTDADESLLGTFADQAAAAIENSRLYEEVRAFSEELEEKVTLRTRELTTINAELGRALSELRDTQSQLVLSERMAGLGALVAGVAHEINSPSAAIRGSVDSLGDNAARLARFAREVGELRMSDEERKAYFHLVERVAPRVAERRMGSPADVRRRARALAQQLADRGVGNAEAAARALAELSADDAALEILPYLTAHPEGVDCLAGYLRESIYLHRNVSAIGNAIKQIQRIVGALKSYSHLDQAKIEPTDIHEGIENTLIILHHELKYGVSVVRRYGELPPIPVFVDELNQVWTNLIHNAVQALQGRGEIVVETLPAGEDGMVAVRVLDNGPGIPPDVLPRIFEPFFTTKVKGEGTGLGLGIVQKIVQKHGGRVDVASEPGRTCFTVWLPTSGPEDRRPVPEPRLSVV